MTATQLRRPGAKCPARSTNPPPAQTCPGRSHLPPTFRPTSEPVPFPSPISTGIQFEPWPHPAPGRLTLEPNEWHVWTIDHLAGITDSALSQEEWNTAEKFRFARDRDAFLSTRTALRHLLAAYTQTAPHAIEFTLGTRLKPRLAQPKIHFNVSHSGGKSLLAFAQSEVGVDLEQLRPIREMKAIVRETYAPGEYRQWLSLPLSEREHAFFLGWTRKEAYVKAIGDGLHVPLNSFEVSLEPGATTEFIDLAGWSLYDFALPDFALPDLALPDLALPEPARPEPARPEPARPSYAAALAIPGSGHKYYAWKLDLALLQTPVLT